MEEITTEKDIASSKFIISKSISYWEWLWSTSTWVNYWWYLSYICFEETKRNYTNLDISE